MGHSEHQQRSAQHSDDPLTCAVITVSDTRTRETDTSGRLIIDALTGAGHTIAHYEIVRDEPEQIGPLVRGLSAICDVVILSGGTGIAPRDTTFEAVEGLLEKRLPGFGELFRMLSYAEIGSAAMMSRAAAGTVGRAIVFSTPGSSGAVRLAMEKLIMPELRHITWVMRGQPG